ncbi:glycerophosphodiester phosphodiesterase [Paenisporosarcina sp. TG-14]|uniref:glycerophosphodiester phosphodiesterase n=1 Tax=Paenisporosarcina sp. TG-14 TaxID=1231057 RepID=UPI0002E58D73|nr:glycerophosphodiester phosphodiesterase [Paenisporosarcina sp. TG-14]
MKIYAHRGSSGTHPENTLAAFKEAARLEIFGVELDVHLTQDDKLVVIHDESINRTSNGKGFVRDLTLSELRAYDFGNWFGDDFKGESIPTLEEVLKIFQNTAHHLNIELKSDIFEYEGMGDKVLHLVEKMGLAERVLISSFDHEAVRNFKKSAPLIEVALVTMDVLVDAYDYARFIPADALHISYPAALRKMTKEAMLKGAIIRVFTVNEVLDVQALQQIGVHAIFTDFPEKMKHVLEAGKIDK